jgi:hypothetical protein
LCSGGFRARSFSRTLHGRWHQDDHHWGRVSVWFKSEKCSCDLCTACDHRVARLAAQWYWCSFDSVHFPCNECVWEYIHLQIIARGHALKYWLRLYTTNRQVAGSIPNGVIGIFQ